MITSIDDVKCTGCGICVERCPLDTLRLDVFVREIPPCQIACPANVNIRGYLYLLKKRELGKAIELIRESLPFPAITGRVCFHPCELRCARKEVDEPVNIHSLERFVADYWLNEKARLWPRLHAGRIAIVGSGAAGLAAAYFLTRMGYRVTVFESGQELGGMLRTSIPEKQLPRDILDAQIDYIKEMGVEFETNTTIGRELTLNELRDRGYKAIFLAIGAQSNDLSLLQKGMPMDELTPFKVDPFTLQTDIPDVFAGGSLVMGRSPLAKVIASAKRAAISIDRYLKNEDLKSEREKQMRRVKKLPKEGIEKQIREEAETGLSEEAALNEAQRCMTCGSQAAIAYPDDCMTCFECEVECPSDAIDVHPFKEQLPPTIKYAEGAK
jgi:NADPH-dependent glutamate synthase beta subunit-like oxidoreductase/Pyruvate/2-oxoacid:ferredoxin oxidoreductase delta subunit